MKILYTLHYLGTGNCFWNLNQNEKISASTAWRCVNDGIYAMGRSEVINKWIPWYSPVTARSMESRFYEKYKLRRIIAAVDGTHCPVLHPSAHETVYINRKGWSSVNVMIVCDLDFVIRYFDCSWPGSSHDARVISQSEVPNLMRQIEDFSLIADCGYACRKWCLTPYPSNMVLDQNQDRYQRRLCAARVIVEQTIGILKNRCRILQRPFRSKIEKFGSVCMAACVMHNMARHFKLQLPDDASNSIEQPPHEQQVQNADIGNAVRNSYVTRYCMT